MIGMRSMVAASLALTTIGYAPFGIAQLPSHWPSRTVIAVILVLSLLCTAIAFLIFFAALLVFVVVRDWWLRRRGWIR